MTPERGLPPIAAAIVSAAPAVVLVLLLTGAWAGGVLTTDLLVPNLAWVITTSGGVGALLVTRRPRNAVGWILWLVGLLFGLSMVATYYVGMSGQSYGGSLPGTVAVGWFAAWSGSAVLTDALLFLPLLFPDGRLPSRAWRWVLMAFLMLGTASTVREMIRPGPLGDGSPVLNPIGVNDGPLPAMLGFVADVLTPIGLVLALVAVVVRYRGGGAIERQQLRWFAASVALAPLGLLTAILLPDFATLGFGVLVFALGLVPVAIGIAVLRYRLYEIDRIISRTIGWLMLTAILGIVFVGLIVGLQALLAPVTERSTVAVAASTLATLALFQPIRRRVQRAVDRRFYRSMADAERALDAFGRQLRDEMELGAVRDRLVGTVGGGGPAGEHRRLAARRQDRRPTAARRMSLRGLRVRADGGLAVSVDGLAAFCHRAWDPSHRRQDGAASCGGPMAPDVSKSQPAGAP
jgi:hypothetical protein